MTSTIRTNAVQGAACSALLLIFPPAAHAAVDPATSVLTVLLSLALILGGFVAVAWAVRRYMPRLNASNPVKVVSTTAVGARERVVVIELDGTWLVLGVGAGNVRLLHTQPAGTDSSRVTQRS